jgi:hypothetical protein
MIAIYLQQKFLSTEYSINMAYNFLDRTELFYLKVVLCLSKQIFQMVILVYVFNNFYGYIKIEKNGKQRIETYRVRI